MSEKNGNFELIKIQTTKNRKCNMTTVQKNQLADFNSAKKIALTITEGCTKRARNSKGEVTNYSGANINGKFYVIGDTEKEIQKPNAIIDGKPAREVFDGYTMLVG